MWNIVCRLAEVLDNCTHGDVRLVDGSDETEGTVQLCIDGTWGTICDGSWGIQDAIVVCTQLGFLTFGTVNLHYCMD